MSHHVSPLKKKKERRTKKNNSVAHPKEGLNTEWKAADEELFN